MRFNSERALLRVRHSGAEHTGFSMGQQEAFSEAVIIFEGGEIAAEMHFADFEACLAGEAKLEAFAASLITGMYVVIGSGLAIRGVVCFTVNVDEHGTVDSGFSIPLRHLATMAGAGPDLGCGPIRLACRSQCSVSWHAHNLWEPEGEGDTNPLNLAQGAVWRNRLGYNKQLARSADDGFDFDVLESEGDDSFDLPAAGDEGELAALTPSFGNSSTANGAAGTNGQEEDRFKRANQEMLQRKIERTFGEDGTVSLQKLIMQHSEQLDSLTAKYRRDLEQQQQVYLDQIRGCRDEIQKLKSELRHEQTRNQRLQQLLRGEIR